MDKCKIGDQVVVKREGKPYRVGVIVSEGRSGKWWNIKFHGVKGLHSYYKTFVERKS